MSCFQFEAMSVPWFIRFDPEYIHVCKHTWVHTESIPSLHIWVKHTIKYFTVLKWSRAVTMAALLQFRNTTVILRPSVGLPSLTSSLQILFWSISLMSFQWSELHTQQVRNTAVGWLTLNSRHHGDLSLDYKASERGTITAEAML